MRIGLLLSGFLTLIAACAQAESRYFTIDDQPTMVKPGMAYNTYNGTYFGSCLSNVAETSTVSNFITNADSEVDVFSSDRSNRISTYANIKASYGLLKAGAQGSYISASSRSALTKHEHITVYVFARTKLESLGIQQEVLNPATRSALEHQHNPAARFREICGDNVVREVVWGYGLQAEIDVASRSAGEINELKSAISAAVSYASNSVSGNREQQVVSRFSNVHETIHAKVRVSGLPMAPSFVGSMEDFGRLLARFFDTAQTVSSDQSFHPQLIYFRTEDYQITGSDSNIVHPSPANLASLDYLAGRVVAFSLAASRLLDISDFQSDKYNFALCEDCSPERVNDEFQRLILVADQLQGAIDACVRRLESGETCLQADTAPTPSSLQDALVQRLPACDGLHPAFSNAMNAICVSTHKIERDCYCRSAEFFLQPFALKETDIQMSILNGFRPGTTIRVQGLGEATNTDTGQVNVQLVQGGSDLTLEGVRQLFSWSNVSSAMPASTQSFMVGGVDPSYPMNSIFPLEPQFFQNVVDLSGQVNLAYVAPHCARGSGEGFCLLRQNAGSDRRGIALVTDLNSH